MKDLIGEAESMMNVNKRDGYNYRSSVGSSELEELQADVDALTGLQVETAARFDALHPALKGEL